MKRLAPSGPSCAFRVLPEVAVGVVGVRVEEGVEEESIFCDRPAPKHKKIVFNKFEKAKERAPKDNFIELVRFIVKVNRRGSQFHK
jgi:hypothetical protein